MKLKNCCNFIDYRGKTPEKAKSGYRFITAKNIGINGFHDEPMEFIPKENYERVMVRGIPSEGDILFTTEAPMGHVGVIPHFDEPFAVGQRIIVIQPKNELLNSSYLVHLLRSRNFQDKVSGRSSGSTVTGIRSKELVEIDIKFPNIVEQHKIAEVLDQLSAVISKRTAELQLYDELIKARFVELFGDVRINNKNWNTKLLKDLCDISRGGSPRPIVDFLGGTVPWIKIGDATDGDNIYINSTKEHIIEAGIKKSRYIKSGSLIFANCGVSLGFCRIINFDGCIHDGWLAFQNINESLDKVFLLMTINQLTDYFRSIAPGGTQPNLNTEIMGNYKQIIPPMELQKEYIGFVKQVDKSKVVVQKALDESQLLFDSLMQKYFG